MCGSAARRVRNTPFVADNPPDVNTTTRSLGTVLAEAGGADMGTYRAFGAWRLRNRTV
jgi:hypothetical protein